MDRLSVMGTRDNITPINDILEEARAGRMFILVDDESRENEGDLVIPAQFATPDTINFMIRHARGLVCLAMTRRRCEEIGLPLMARTNGARLQTAFTISIEARDGVTTGISAADRARTIGVAISAEMGKADIVSPGHIFPLMARDGGTLVRAGHTEASVDVARLVGLIPAAVICEIVNDDGTIARLPDLIKFSQQHNLQLGTIADLIAYRRRTEKLVRRTEQGIFVDHRGTDWRIIGYESTIDHVEHLALVKGEVSGEAPVLVRMHAVDVLDDIIDGFHSDVLHTAMTHIAAKGLGVVVLIRERRQGAVAECIRQIDNKQDPRLPLQDYGIGAQILRDLDIRRIVLLSSHRRPLAGLEGYGIDIFDHYEMGSRS